MSSPSAFWFLLVVRSIGRFGSLGPSLISATRAAAPHAIATFLMRSLSAVCPTASPPPVAASVKVRPVRVLVHRQDSRRATRADLAGRRADQLGRVVNARLLLHAGAPRREGDGALRVVEVALHLVHPLAVVELQDVVDEVDAEHHASPELSRGAEVRSRGWVDCRVGDDSRVHVLLQRLVEDVLGVSPSDVFFF